MYKPGEGNRLAPYMRYANARDNTKELMLALACLLLTGDVSCARHHVKVALPLLGNVPRDLLGLQQG